jgi:hypothetical protein
VFSCQSPKHPQTPRAGVLCTDASAPNGAEKYRTKIGRDPRQRPSRKKEIFGLERAHYVGLPENSCVLRIFHLRESRGRPRAGRPSMRLADRGDHFEQLRGARAATPCTTSLGGVRRRVRPTLAGRGHLRHRFRQVHRTRSPRSARRASRQSSRIPKVPSGLEEEPGCGHQEDCRHPNRRCLGHSPGLEG